MRAAASLPITMLIFGLVFAGSAEACEPNEIRTDIDRPIYISEVVVSLSESDCPDDGVDFNEPIIQQGKRVQFWFRMQGNRDYLSSPISRQPFDIRFFRKDAGGLVFFDAIGVGPVDPKIAAVEASQNSGRFDWRIWVRKRVFYVPGNYVVSVTQGTTEICSVSEDGQRDCGVEFSVRN
jgi:hypothetical protein